MAGGGVSAVATDAMDVTFRAAPTAPGHVRTLVELRLAVWDLAELIDDVALIASELVTNAVQHAPGPQIRVRFTRVRHGVLLEVWDSSDQVPEPVVASDEGTSGRGLAIAAALASECGASPTEPHGKWTWARVQG